MSEPANATTLQSLLKANGHGDLGRRAVSDALRELWALGKAADAGQGKYEAVPPFRRTA